MLSEHVELLCVKGNDDEFKAHEKVSENKSQGKHENKKEWDEIDEQNEGVIELLINNKLRIIEENCNFREGSQDIASRTRNV